jgi:hypothetical protein
MKIAPRNSPSARSTAFRLFSPRAAKNAPSSRGFVTVMVIIMFVFIAAAIVSLTLLFATEMHRTRAAVAGAQLRQLLLAATPAVQQELTRHGTAARDITIPTPVTGATLTAHIITIAPDKVTIRITAKLPASATSQTLTYLHKAQAWQLQSAVISAQP